MPDHETVEDLLKCLDDLVGPLAGEGNALHLRAATAVCRRAVELAVNRYLGPREPSLADSHHMHLKMLCVRVHCPDATVVHQLNWAWCAASTALHPRRESVPAGLSEILQWRDAIHAFVEIAEDEASAQ